MTLTSKQIDAIKLGEPVRVVFPEIGEECIVLRATSYEGARYSPEGVDPRQAYPAIDEAWKDDWEFPGMEDYDHYEEKKR